jgi:ornithine decarboxylase
VTKSYQNTAQFIGQEAPLESFYCLSKGALAKQVQRFKTGFSGVVAYAVKANPTSELVSGLAACGVNAYDVASIPEVALVRATIPDADIMYDNPVKSQDEITRAYHEFGVKSYALDDVGEFTKIDSIIGSDESVQLTVRFKIPSNTAKYDLSQKFGADEALSVRLLKMVAAAGYRCGLTFHPGSQCSDVSAYTVYIEKAAEIAKEAGVPIVSLNVGGGFPSRYLGEELPNLEDYFRAIGESFEKAFAGTDTTLISEPGRCLVDSCISLLCQVKHRREDQTLFINDGVYGGFMEQLFSPIVHPVRAFRGKKELTGDCGAYTVWGPTCDSLDVLAHQPILPMDIGEGDWLEFGLMGGYGSSTATQFNGFTSNRYVFVEEGFPYPDGVLN